MPSVDGVTRLDYDADAVVGGMIGGVGQRVLSGVAKKTAGEFFKAVDDVLTGKAPAIRSPRGEPRSMCLTSSAPAVFTAPAASGVAVGGSEFVKGARLRGRRWRSPASWWAVS